MIHITFEDIVKLNISPSTCYSWAEETIKRKKEALLPPKINMKLSAGVFFNVMPSHIVLDKPFMGCKVVTRYPQRIPSLDAEIMLFDAATGEFLALMDGRWITAMRTGAVAAHSVMLFAKKNFTTIGIMGLGNIARSTLLILLERLPKDRRLTIKLLKYKGQEVLFANRFRNYPNVDFVYVDNTIDLVKGSEVVLSGATYLPNDVCPDFAFDKGVLVQPIHTLGFTNCDLFFDKVFADDYSHVSGFKNFSKFKSFNEVCDVVNNNVSGRENDEERILVYNIGISIHDIAFAARIYEMVKDKSNNIDVKKPDGKFWV